MYLWHLRRKKVTGDGYDTYRGFVIRAASEAAARKRAAQEDRFDSEIWLNAKTASCKRLREKGKAGVILEDFLDG